MAGFQGGSAWKMAQDITEGYATVNLHTLKRFQMADLKKLAFELGKFERTIRGEQVPLDDIDAIKAKNRKLQRIAQALMMMRDFAQRRFKTRI
jgi:hypothetical protein